MNVGTVIPMLSEKSQVRGPHEGESSEAGTRGGLTRRSCEETVMVLEQRGQLGAGETRQQDGGTPDSTSKRNSSADL